MINVTSEQLGPLEFCRLKPLPFITELESDKMSHRILKEALQQAGCVGLYQVGCGSGSGGQVDHL